jgi:hypothetical protein
MGRKGESGMCCKLEHMWEREPRMVRKLDWVRNPADSRPGTRGQRRLAAEDVQASIATFQAASALSQAPTHRTIAGRWRERRPESRGRGGRRRLRCLARSGAPALGWKAVPDVDARRFHAANPLWRAPRNHGKLKMLGVPISERSASRNLRTVLRSPSQPGRHSFGITWARSYR